VQDVPVLLLVVTTLQDRDVLHYTEAACGECMARKQRLPHEAYGVVGSTWHVTVNADRSRGTPFSEVELGHTILTNWVNGCRNVGAIPHLVCLMPDHLHMIIEVTSVDLIEIMRRLKSHSTAIYRARKHSSPLWQQSFHDHGLRESRDFESAVEYILFNPARAELVTDWRDYPLLMGDLLKRDDSSV
jgi:REP element-mobilizing transposase RayT